MSNSKLGMTMKSMKLGITIAGLCLASAAAQAQMANCTTLHIACLPNVVAGPVVNAVPVVHSLAPGFPYSTYLPNEGSKANTAKAVQAEFPGAIIWAFLNNPQINNQITNMPDTMLGMLSHEYFVETAGSPYSTQVLMQFAAEKLSAANLLRFRASFGVDMDYAVAYGFAPPAVAAAYRAGAAYPMIHRSQVHYASLNLNAATPNGVTPYVPSPLANMALSDIWMEFFCAGEGTTVVEASVMAGTYAAGPLTLAATVGTAIGSGLYYAGEWVSPGVYEDLIENLVSLFGTPYINDKLPTGTITVGDPIEAGAPPSTSYWCPSAGLDCPW